MFVSAMMVCCDSILRSVLLWVLALGSCFGCFGVFGDCCGAFVVAKDALLISSCTVYKYGNMGRKS